jgi:putative addiction module component (TIGR02574 family)
LRPAFFWFFTELGEHCPGSGGAFDKLSQTECGECPGASIPEPEWFFFPVHPNLPPFGLRYPSREVNSLTHRKKTMPDTAAELANRGRQLPREERERLVDELLESLNEPAAAELDAAWSSEIERRLAAYDRGEIQALSAEEVFAKARSLAK